MSGAVTCQPRSCYLAFLRLTSAARTQTQLAQDLVCRADALKRGESRCAGALDVELQSASADLGGSQGKDEQDEISKWSVRGNSF
jgi:hypothetical protein